MGNKKITGWQDWQDRRTNNCISFFYPANPAILLFFVLCNQKCHLFLLISEPWRKIDRK
jgi:hypothetical protein